MTTILQNSYYEDNELYTPAIAEDLINGLNEWHNT